MWIRRLFQTGILFAVLWLSALGVIRARPYDDAAIRAMLGTHDCVDVVGAAARPCFMGILVGVTVRDEALAVLAAHPWVDEISESGTVISWSWSGAQPGLIDASQDGLISLSSNGRTRQMRILTRMEFGDVWLSQGAPGQPQYRLPDQLFYRGQRAGHHHAGLSVHADRVLVTAGVAGAR